MPEEIKLSAVAKRRRLNGNASIIVESPVDADSSLQTQTPPDEIRNSVVPSSSLVSPDTTELRSNSFAPLVNKEIVQFSNSREIEKLNDSTLRIRLSKRQKCTICGTYSLWVKNGSIRVNGATIDESNKLHYVDTNTMFELPTITAISRIVEFEVHSRDDPLPSFGARNSWLWTSPDGEELYHASFFVCGYSKFPEDTSPMVQEFDDGFIDIVAHSISSWDHAEKQTLGPVIFVCGRQYSGTASSLLCILNSILTARSTSDNALYAAEGILFFDLEYDLPVLGPPETISLSYIQEPILGSPYLNLGTFSSGSITDKIRLLLSHPAHVQGSISNKNQQLSSMCKTIDSIRKQRHRRCPLVIRSKECFEQFFQSRSGFTINMFVPNIIIFLAPENALKNNRLAEGIREKYNGTPMISLPLLAGRGPSLCVQHEILLRSYFYFRGYRSDHPQWGCLPLELDRGGHVWLRYGKGSDIVLMTSFQLGQLEINDLKESLIGLLVLIVSQRSTDDHLYDPNQEGFHIPKPCDVQANVNIAEDDNCLGLGVIASFDRRNQRICIITPVSLDVFDSHHRRGIKVHIYVQSAYPDGRFDTAWMQQELDRILGQKKAINPVYKRNLNTTYAEKF